MTKVDSREKNDSDFSGVSQVNGRPLNVEEKLLSTSQVRILGRVGVALQIHSWRVRTRTAKETHHGVNYLSLSNDMVKESLCGNATVEIFTKHTSTARTLFPSAAALFFIPVVPSACKV